MRETKILVVDDDPAIVKFISANLKASGYQAQTAGNGAQAMNAIEEDLPDLVILDVMMPGTNGAEVCRRLREWSNIPIIMLSARGDVMDKVKCLELGADDYITKPFGVDELLARVKAVLRRVAGERPRPGQGVFAWDNVRVDFAMRRITVDGAEVRLTPTEYTLLQELVLNADKVLTHSMLLHRVWGPEYSDDRQYLHVFMGHLRKRLEKDPQNPTHIVTVPAVGYVFRTTQSA